MPTGSGTAWEAPLRSAAVGIVLLIEPWVLAWWPFCPDPLSWDFPSDVALTRRPFPSFVSHVAGAQYVFRGRMRKSVKSATLGTYVPVGETK